MLVDDVETVLTKAAQGDAVAASRDSTSGKRDMAANMQARLSGDEFRADAEARQEALDDRLHSASDRTESASAVTSGHRLASSSAPAAHGYAASKFGVEGIPASGGLADATVTLLTIGYMSSRWLAKAGSYEKEHHTIDAPSGR